MHLPKPIEIRVSAGTPILQTDVSKPWNPYREGTRSETVTMTTQKLDLLLDEFGVLWIRFHFGEGPLGIEHIKADDLNLGEQLHDQIPFGDLRSLLHGSSARTKGLMPRLKLGRDLEFLIFYLGTADRASYRTLLRYVDDWWNRVSDSVREHITSLPVGTSLVSWQDYPWEHGLPVPLQKGTLEAIGSNVAPNVRSVILTEPLDLDVDHLGRAFPSLEEVHASDDRFIKGELGRLLGGGEGEVTHLSMSP